MDGGGVVAVSEESRDSSTGDSVSSERLELDEAQHPFSRQSTPDRLADALTGGRAGNSSQY